MPDRHAASFRFYIHGDYSNIRSDRVRIVSRISDVTGNFITMRALLYFKMAFNSSCCFFQVADAVTACCLFLEKQIEPSNVIGICMFADQHGCKDLSSKAMTYIEQHFEQVSFQT